jgi:organic hydroperoxide reductase OsmC/OhrA
MTEGGAKRPRLKDPIEGDPFAKICDVELKHTDGCKFDARFRTKEGDLLMAEPFPVGVGHGPEAVTMLNMATSYCMTASLNFYLARARVVPLALRSRGHVTMRLTDEHYRRIEAMEIDIRIEVEERHRKRLERALDRFTTFCIVSESIRGSFPITVRVHHPWGVHESVLE